MTKKQKSLDLNMKLEIYVCVKLAAHQKAKKGRQNGLNSLTLFTILKKRKYGIY
jgi:hypothetical protein